MRNRVQVLVLALHSLGKAQAFVRTAVTGQHGCEEEEKMHHHGHVFASLDFSALTSTRRAQQAHIGLHK